MRSQIIILLAVFSNHVTAGIVRYRGGAYVRHDKFRRFYNTSSVVLTSDLQTSTPTLLPSPSTSSLDATSKVSTLEDAQTTGPLQSPSPLPNPNDNSAVPVSQSSATENTQSLIPSKAAISSYGLSTPLIGPSLAPSVPESGASISTSFGVSSVNQGGQQAAVTKPTETTSRFNLGVNGNGGIKAEVGTSLPVSTQLSTPLGQGSSVATPTPTVTPSQPSSISKSQVPTSSAIIQFGPSNSAEFDPVTVSSLSVAPTASGIQYPGTQNGNRAMATGFNDVYKKLDVTSQCNPQDSNQATACVAGELASCQSDGTYVLKSCPDGQSCYALPKLSGGTGIEVACAVPSDAVVRLSGGSDSGNGAAAMSKVVPSAQSAVTLVPGSSQASSRSPETRSVQTPVQMLSSSSPATLTPSSQGPESVATPTVTNVQSLTKLPQTESVQIPVHRSSSSFQAAVTSLADNPANDVIASASPETESTHSSAQGVQSIFQATTNAASQQKSATAIADTQPSASTQAASSKQSVQTLQSFPPAQATHNTQQPAPIPSTSEISSTPVQTQKASPIQSNAASETASAASSAAIADGGPLFSLPTTTQKDADQPAQTAASNILAQETSKAAQSPSALAQEQPARSTETSLVPAPHIAQAVPEASQPTKAKGASTPTSNPDDGGGVRIVPEGGSDADSPSTTAAPNTNGAAGTEEKLAVQNAVAQNPNQGGTPIYITVTVTTTARDLSPTA